ncbi:hypothetical protein DACRYDRAFT_119994 [Dacryopinax primogenitus]|uniref:Uncharacterized protein n=1 Tax=Dacryopinax primogenitus (strain DJM 731) TaxID=1858805 RepID=M5FN15_DACPD|nr:uncharacterized protein DACRYDRAFT_119994 [Dacryopinax primogenitus]EJT96655.1 hypothetical protein DACRYDRAFT_119994 [Dacryopinax primogenitus]
MATPTSLIQWKEDSPGSGYMDYFGPLSNQGLLPIGNTPRFAFVCCQSARVDEEELYFTWDGYRFRKLKEGDCHPQYSNLIFRLVLGKPTWANPHIARSSQLRDTVHSSVPHFQAGKKGGAISLTYGGNTVEASSRSEPEATPSALPLPASPTKVARFRTPQQATHQSAPPPDSSASNHQPNRAWNPNTSQRTQLFIKKLAQASETYDGAYMPSRLKVLFRQGKPSSQPPTHPVETPVPTALETDAANAQQYRQRANTAQQAFSDIMDVYQKRTSELKLSAHIQQESPFNDGLSKLEEQMNQMNASMEILRKTVGQYKDGMEMQTQKDRGARLAVEKTLEDTFSFAEWSFGGKEKDINVDTVERRIDEVEETVARIQKLEKAQRIPELDASQPYNGPEEDMKQTKTTEDIASAEERLQRMWREHTGMKERLDGTRPPDRKTMNEQLIERGITAVTSAYRKAGRCLYQDSSRKMEDVMGDLQTEMDRMAGAAKLIVSPMGADRATILGELNSTNRIKNSS